MGLRNSELKSGVNTARVADSVHGQDVTLPRFQFRAELQGSGFVFTAILKVAELLVEQSPIQERS